MFGCGFQFFGFLIVIVFCEFAIAGWKVNDQDIQMEEEARGIAPVTPIGEMMAPPANLPVDVIMGTATPFGSKPNSPSDEKPVSKTETEATAATITVVDVDQSKTEIHPCAPEIVAQAVAKALQNANASSPPPPINPEVLLLFENVTVSKICYSEI